jgi:ubiquinone/menaquinone biosynthesis C-methylase UbiE
MKMGHEAIRNYWLSQAVTHGQSPAASWADVNAINLEVAEISKHLRDGARVIDIGCANGFSTLQYAARFEIDIKGIDYIPEMIACANERLRTMDRKLKGAARFDVGDICNLGGVDGKYDTAIVTRVIINLGDRERQIAAIREAARVVKCGGTLLLSEATREGWSRLNALRSEWGLDAIPEPPFNLYIDEELGRSAAPDLLDLVEISNFSSTYSVATRVIKPLLAQAIKDGPDPARPDMEWNRFFSFLPAVGDYGTQKLFVFRRR